MWLMGAGEREDWRSQPGQHMMNPHWHDEDFVISSVLQKASGRMYTEGACRGRS